MKVIVKLSSKTDELVIYENVRYLDFTSGIAIIVTDSTNKSVNISQILSITE